MLPAFALSEAQQDTIEVPSIAQTERRAQWLASNGITENYQQIRAMFTEELLKEFLPMHPNAAKDFNKTRLDWVAQELAVRYTPETIRTLQQRGIDPLRNSLIGIPTPAHFYEMSDDIILGEVLFPRSLSEIRELSAKFRD
jgi:hypothetical protein